MNSQLDRVEVFPWNSNFETGIDIIDQQHHRLVDLLNTLASTLSGGDHDEIMRVFDQLADYAHYHFETEEAVWHEYFDDADEWFAAHKETHSSFIPEVLALKEQDKAKPVPEVVEDIIKFLIRWLAFHIVDEDMRMALTIAEMKQGHSLEEAKLRAEQKMSGSIRILVDTVLSMYDNLSSRTLELMRERLERQKVERELRSLNERLEQLSITDQLTGLYNRRYFDQVLQREIKRCVREQRNLSLLLFDVDFFKKLNDHYGHVAGDEALQKIATALRKLCHRPGDFCFRVGGEEFAVIIENPQACEAEAFAEKLRLAIAALKIEHVKSGVADHLTISIGVVSHTPSQGDTVDRYLRAVDVQLYKAKESGRNRVASASI